MAGTKRTTVAQRMAEQIAAEQVQMALAADAAREAAKTPLPTPSEKLPVADTKPVNPKDGIGRTKLPLHLWPATATAMGCIGLLEGRHKYGSLNFRATDIAASVYVAACKRHLDAWMEGEDKAPDSGVPHLANALACLAIIVDAKAVGTLIDDRNYNGLGYRALVDELTPLVAHLADLHADKAPKHYTIQD